MSLLTKMRIIGLAGLAGLVLACGSGDGGNGPKPGCLKDADCKGNRICVEGMCVEGEKPKEDLYIPDKDTISEKDNYQPNCTSHAEKVCSGDELLWYDSCGNPENMIEKCKYGCSNGMCLEQPPACETDADCPEGEDCFDGECISAGCSSSEYTCNDGSCIPQSYVCDGGEDCNGGEDEQNCGGPCKLGESAGLYYVMIEDKYGWNPSEVGCDGNSPGADIDFVGLTDENTIFPVEFKTAFDYCTQDQESTLCYNNGHEDVESATLGVTEGNYLSLNGGTLVLHFEDNSNKKLDILCKYNLFIKEEYSPNRPAFEEYYSVSIGETEEGPWIPLADTISGSAFVEAKWEW